MKTIQIEIFDLIEKYKVNELQVHVSVYGGRSKVSLKKDK